MDGKTTGTTGSSEMKIKEVKDAEIKADKMKNGYGDAVFAAVEWNTQERNFVEAGNNPNSGSDSSKRTSNVSFGSTLIMKFAEKIKDIIEGVTLKVKGDKDKKKEKEEELENRNDGPEDRQ